LSRLPTFRHATDGGQDIADEALEFASVIGVELTGWQQLVLRDWLATTDDGRWCHRTGCLIVPRQSGKSVLLTVRYLHALYFGAEESILATAHRFATVQGQFTDMVALVDGSDALRRRTRRVLTGTRNQLIETMSGSVMQLASRPNTMSGGSRGRSYDLIGLDEALILDQAGPYMSGVLPTQSARPNPQMLYASSGGDHDSTQLSAVRAAGYDRTPGLCLHEWAAGDGDDLAAEATVAKTNPDYPTRPTPEAVAAERATLTSTAFARERLGVWSTGAPEPALNFDTFARAVVPSAGFPATGAAKLAVDVSISRAGERTSAVAVAWRTEGRVHAVLVQQAPDTAWVAGRVAEVAARYGLVEVWFAPGGAEDVATGLVSAGLTVQRRTYAGLRAAAARLAELLGEDQVQVQHSPTLMLAARTVPKTKAADGSWGFSAKAGAPSAGLNAVALAVTAVDTDPTPEAHIW
jgi:hypothetical protein